MTSAQKQLSIIIPVRNWDIGLLIKALTTEIDSLAFEDRVEIIIADDYSEEQYRDLNRIHVQGVECISYYELDRNIGRAAIRNDLLARAIGRYILFLDADVLPDNPDFLATYFGCIEKKEQLVCGGISYQNRLLTEQEYNFYFYKGSRTEWVPAVERQQTAWRYFFSANVLIKRSILNRIGLDERFSGYGYEDIEWGIRLDQTFGIRHIENTCSHLGLVEKKESFCRMRKSIRNFMLLQEIHPEIFHQTGVASTVNLLSKFPAVALGAMDTICSAVFALSPLHSLSLFCFQLDKAVLFTRAARKNKENAGNSTPSSPERGGV
jgi:predicted glycosyltransferase involved in capsule biosynthesis